MAQSPLLGSRISLISKKNIRYEGTLYSINEANATVALQNVRSYGTEGREKADPSCTFVAPQESVHPYLLFRGCDIRDLHVHENQEDPGIQQDAPPEPPSTLQVDVPSLEPQNTTEQTAKEEEIVANEDPAVEAVDDSAQPPTTQENEEQKINGVPALPEEKTSTEKADKGTPVDSAVKSSNNEERKPRQQGRGAGNRRSKKPPAFQVGTGASLLNRKERGGDGGPTVTPASDFDFESNLKQFNKEESDDEAGDAPHEPTSYEKDDFFDSISCDALDRQAGIDNRLRGAAERNLNTETFGAVALNSQRRRRRYRGGRGGGRGRGRGRGGRGRGGRGRGRGRSVDGGRWQHAQTRGGE